MAPGGVLCERAVDAASMVEFPPFSTAHAEEAWLIVSAVVANKHGATRGTHHGCAGGDDWDLFTASSDSLARVAGQFRCTVSCGASARTTRHPAGHGPAGHEALSHCCDDGVSIRPGVSWRGSTSSHLAER